MKRLLLITILLISTTCCYAGGIGYINYEKVAENYHFAKKSVQEIEMRSREIQQFLINKENEFKKLESPVQKKKFEEQVQNELKTKETEFNNFREKREEEVYTRIHAVAEKIRLEKGLDALLDARSVFSGGVDITEILIQKLNSNAVR